LELADAVVMTQVTIRSVALEHSLKALFLPHIHSGGRLPGNGLNLFLSFDEMMDRDDSSTLSSTGGSFVQGMLEHLLSLVGVTLSTKNSFRRLLNRVSVGTRVGWGRSSRDSTLLVRKTPYSKDLQLEYRLCDNTCNVHLALAALLVAGMDGISRTLALQNALDGSAGACTKEPLLPQSLSEAIDALANDTWLVATIAPYVGDAFLAFRREEADRTDMMSLEDEIQEALENA
jgi:glutamine synthetase